MQKMSLASLALANCVTSKPFGTRRPENSPPKHKGRKEKETEKTNKSLRKIRIRAALRLLCVLCLCGESTWHCRGQTRGEQLRNSAQPIPILWLTIAVSQCLAGEVRWYVLLLKASGVLC